MEVLRSTQAPLVAGQKEWRGPEQEKQSFVICLALAVLSQLSALRCYNVVTPSFARIDASQHDKWRSEFQSAKEVLVTSSVISDTRRCARDGFLRASQSNTKPREKPFLPYTLQPRPSTFRFPPIWSHEGRMLSAVRSLRLMTMWFTQWERGYVNRTRHCTHKAYTHRSGRDFVEK
jgi:hypothetical protein